MGNSPGASDAEGQWFGLPSRALQGLHRILPIFLACCALALPAQVVSREYQLKAVFLYRFAQFVDWPKTAFTAPDSPLVIGVLGRDPFGESLKAAVQNERAHNRPLMVQYYGRVEEVKDCHLLFIAPSEDERLERILTDLQGRSILTVGEAEDFAVRSGMIQFIRAQNRIRFRINLDAARSANLQISSKLLGLAEVVAATRR